MVATVAGVLLIAVSLLLLAVSVVPLASCMDHPPRLPKFESRRVKDHRRCLASIARLERELGMESTEQLRETLFGEPAPRPAGESLERRRRDGWTDEPGQLIELTQALTEVREREEAKPRATWDEAYRSSYARGYTNGRAAWSSDKFEVF
jgi:hypothetical protein